MSKPLKILRENLLEHPSVRAWSVTGPKRVEPGSIAVIKPWMKNAMFGTYKSGVYRLEGVGLGGSAVIAKRCPRLTAAVERLMYEEFLPQLPLPTLACYGSVDEPDGESCWLFLEEAIGQRYSPLNPEHRALAARWLAAVHTVGRDPGWKTRLPDRGPEQYLRMLRSCRAKVHEQFTNPSLPSDCAPVLQTVAEQCDLLEAHWSELESICQMMPRSIFHGDFVVKNLCVRRAADGLQLLVFDWEYSGWGAPSTDLVQFTGHTASPDLAIYRSCLQNGPTQPDDTQVRGLAECGRLFRVVETMYWACLGLVPETPLWLLKPISELRIYSQRMAQALGETGWKTSKIEVAMRREAPNG
jgi:thiamine kinase-like enzyme